MAHRGICPYDYKHQVPNHRFELHVLICPKKFNVNADESDKKSLVSDDSESSDRTIDEKIKLLINTDQKDDLKLLTLAEYVNASESRRTLYRHCLRNYLCRQIVNVSHSKKKLRNFSEWTYKIRKNIFFLK